jgi:hypothetical protein
LLAHALRQKALESATTVRFPDPLDSGKMTEEFTDHSLLSLPIAGVVGAFTLSQRLGLPSASVPI